MVQKFSKKWKIAIFLDFFIFLSFVYHLCFQCCKNSPKNGKLQFSTIFSFYYHFFISFFHLFNHFLHFLSVLFICLIIFLHFLIMFFSFPFSLFIFSCFFPFHFSLFIFIILFISIFSFDALVFFQLLPAFSFNSFYSMS